MTVNYNCPKLQTSHTPNFPPIILGQFQIQDILDPVWWISSTRCHSATPSYPRVIQNLGQNTMENDPNLSVNLTQTLGPFYSAFWPRFLTSLKDPLRC